MSDCFVNAKDSRCLPRYNHFFAGRATSETLAPRFSAAALGGGVRLRCVRQQGAIAGGSTSMHLVNLPFNMSSRGRFNTP